MAGIPGSTALATLAAEAQAIRLDDAPAEAIRQAKLCILDTVGCMLAGTRTQESELIRKCAAAAGPQAGEGLTVFGTGMRQDLAGAMQINGYHGDVLELNDLIGGHASIGNVTAALAIAEMEDVHGRQLLQAVMRGIESTARIYDAVYPTLKRFTEVGMVPVGLPSSIGAAAASASLLRLSEAQTLQAMAIAGGLAGWCPAEVIFGQGGSMKPLLFGAQPALSGAMGALYARQGMTGPLRLLDSPVGYFASVSHDAGLAVPAGSRRWALETPRRKLHACCGYIHSALDAMASLRDRVGAAIREGVIQVRVAPYVADVVSKPGPPTSANDARFHLQYCLALAACGMDVVLPEHSIEFRGLLESPGLVDAMQRIEVIADARLTHYHQCELRVELAGRAPWVEALDAPRGSPQAPLSPAEIEDKFRRLAAPAIGAERSAKFMGELADLESCASVRRLLASIA